jgi:hypothetical protein
MPGLFPISEHADVRFGTLILVGRKDKEMMNRAILEAAILGFEQQRERIDATIAELKAQLGGEKALTGSANAPESKPRRKMSAKAKKAIRDAQKKRWADFHAAQEAGKPKAAVKAPAKKATVKAAPKAAPKKKMSAATKAKLAANLAKARAAKKAKATSGGTVPF